jgi:hypothetical protein
VLKGGGADRQETSSATPTHVLFSSPAGQAGDQPWPPSIVKTRQRAFTRGDRREKLTRTVGPRTRSPASHQHVGSAWFPHPPRPVHQPCTPVWRDSHLLLPRGSCRFSGERRRSKRTPCMRPNRLRHRREVRQGRRGVRRVTPDRKTENDAPRIALRLGRCIDCICPVRSWCGRRRGCLWTGPTPVALHRELCGSSITGQLPVSRGGTPRLGWDVQWAAQPRSRRGTRGASGAMDARRLRRWGPESEDPRSSRRLGRSNLPTRAAGKALPCHPRLPSSSPALGGAAPAGMNPWRSWGLPSCCFGGQNQRVWRSMRLSARCRSNGW